MELSLVDRNITHLSQILNLLPSTISNNAADVSSTTLRILNLHGNRIRSIESLKEMPVLFQLLIMDLSSNHISYIESLHFFRYLRVLNLSNNKIVQIQGLDTLHHLSKLVLSYNPIVSLVGLVQMHGSQFQLAHLDLTQTQVQSVSEVFYLSGLVVRETPTFIFSQHSYHASSRILKINLVLVIQNSLFLRREKSGRKKCNKPFRFIFFTGLCS
ncbi:hypothetical protein HMI55_007140 [Coelomomyces lativittatus]|nr:hypothetical protein HMI56_001069 [Coelomomyces lativittatus]KAJ1518319.1 hypothetical protein HMI55_007140 [Coelomomyces lativittatus]